MADSDVTSKDDIKTEILGKIDFNSRYNKEINPNFNIFLAINKIEDNKELFYFYSILINKFNDKDINNEDKHDIYINIFKKIKINLYNYVNKENIIFYYIVNYICILYNDNTHISSINTDATTLYNLKEILIYAFCNNKDDKDDKDITNIKTITDNIDDIKLFINILYVYLCNLLGYNNYTIITQLHKKLKDLDNNNIKLLYLCNFIFNDYDITHLLLYKKIKIENTNINTYLNNSDDKYAFKNNDTVIVDPAGLPFMKADSSPSGVSDIIKVFLKEVPYPCVDAINHFKDVTEVNIYINKNNVGVFLCDYNNNINIIHAIGPNFNTTNYFNDITIIPEKIKELLLIIYKSVFNEIKKDNKFKTVIMVPISGDLFASEALKNFKLVGIETEVNLIIHLTPEVIYEALLEVYNTNDEIPDIKLLVLEKKDFENLKEIYGNDIDIS